MYGRLVRESAPLSREREVGGTSSSRCREAQEEQQGSSPWSHRIKGAGHPRGNSLMTRKRRAGRRGTGIQVYLSRWQPRGRILPFTDPLDSSYACSNKPAVQPREAHDRFARGRKRKIVGKREGNGCQERREKMSKAVFTTGHASPTGNW